MKKHKNMYIIRAVISLSAAMNIVDIFIKPGYFYKSLIKILLFGTAPAIYFVINKNERYNLKKLFRFDKKSIKIPFILGLSAYIVIVGGYLLLKKYLDFSQITANLAADVGVTASNFIWVSLYISFCNSFLEEFFFRGFGFLILKNHVNRNFALIFSACVFAFYHIGMTLGWVNIFLYCLGFAGLVVGGMIFSISDEKSGSIFPSWIMHIFINFGINTVGLMLFGII